MPERYWTPTRSYDFQLIIKNKDYTPDLQRVSILSSLTVPYQTILIDMFIDSNDLILDKIYGQDKLKLHARLLGQTDNTPIEEVNFELMLLNVKYDIMIKSTDQQDRQKDRSAVRLITVNRKPFQTMSSIVNSISFGSTPSEVVTSLVNTLETSPKISFQQAGLNPEKFDQILVPPLTFYNAVNYLSMQFGIYSKGVMGFGCYYDNTIYLKNLTEKIKSSHLFTIDYLAIDTKELEKTIQQGVDGKKFYTWTDVLTTYKGNTIYSYIAPRNRYVVKPSNLLYSNIDVDLRTEAKFYGLVSRDTKLFYDKETISDRRRGFHIKHTGYDESDTFVGYPDLADMAMITVELISKNLTLLNFMNVGEAVKFNTKIPDYTQLAGKYILKSSELRFERIREWEAYATVNLMRTNKATI